MNSQRLGPQQQRLAAARAVQDMFPVGLALALLKEQQMHMDGCQP